MSIMSPAQISSDLCQFIWVGMKGAHKNGAHYIDVIASIYCGRLLSSEYYVYSYLAPTISPILADFYVTIGMTTLSRKQI